MNFGQLIEFNMRNIFLEKSYTKWSGETIPRSFSENLDPGPGILDPGPWSRTLKTWTLDLDPAKPGI